MMQATPKLVGRRPRAWGSWLKQRSAATAMRLGIRGKLIGTLMLAGLLPLAISLVAGALAIQQVRARFAGEAFRALAQQHAEHLSTLLVAQVDLFRLIAHLPVATDLLEVASSGPPPSPAEIAAIEAKWPSLGPDDPPLREILGNKLAQRWQLVQRQRPRLAEVLVTDRHGRLVAATNKTTDYYQADEAWWQACWAKGRGRIVLSEIVFDPSAQAGNGQQGAYVVDLCLPIYGPQAGSDSSLPVGIAKLSLEAEWVLAELRGASVADRDALGGDIWLISAEGRRAVDQSSRLESVPQPLAEAIASRSNGYLVTQAMAGREVIGFAPIVFPAQVLQAPQDWVVAVSGPLEAALGSTQLMLWTVLLGGTLIVFCCFIAGLWIARRELLRPLLTLRHGARELEEGHLDFRLQGPDQPASIFRHDEIGQLATDFNHMAAELERSVGELAKANRLKQQFIDLASHELRTPITYILGVTELAQRRHSPEAPLLARIAAKAHRLNRIVGNMFKLLKSGLFESTLHLGPVDVDQMITTAVHELEPFLKARSQTLEVHVPRGLEPISADAEKLHDIVNNLLSNAIRFSPDGTTQKLEVLDHDTNVEIIVSDSGPGIAAEDLPYVFEPFFRGQTGITSHTSGEYEYMTRGIGLGLSVVKRFAELHGGTVRAESTPTGARFHVILPKHPTVEAAAPPPHHEPVTTPAAPAK